MQWIRMGVELSVKKWDFIFCMFYLRQCFFTQWVNDFLLSVLYALHL